MDGDLENGVRSGMIAVEGSEVLRKVGGEEGCVERCVVIMWGRCRFSGDRAVEWAVKPSLLIGRDIW